MRGKVVDSLVIESCADSNVCFRLKKKKNNLAPIQLFITDARFICTEALDVRRLIMRTYRMASESRMEDSPRTIYVFFYIYIYIFFFINPNHHL